MAETIAVTLRLFAVFREALGSGTLEREVPAGTTVGQLLARLIDEYPALAGAEATVSFSVNRTYASADTVLHAGDEVAFIPPVSGGATLICAGGSRIEAWEMQSTYSLRSEQSSLSPGRGPG